MKTKTNVRAGQDRLQEELGVCGADGAL